MGWRFLWLGLPVAHAPIGQDGDLVSETGRMPGLEGRGLWQPHPHLSHPCPGQLYPVPRVEYLRMRDSIGPPCAAPSGTEYMLNYITTSGCRLLELGPGNTGVTGE